LTTLFGTSEPPKRRQPLLPVLTVLFVISYGLMTLLIVEQGNTIQSQRTLIQQLLGDSNELSAMKGKVATEHAHVADTQSQPNTQQQAPSTQAAPSEKTKASKGHSKVRQPAPVIPPVPASDIADSRRTLMSI